MTGRSEGSEKGRSGDRPGGRGEGREIGWGLSAAGSDDDIMLRKVVFAVSVAVVACLGAWILFTSALGGRQGVPMLSAADSAPDAEIVYTVKLREFGADERNVVEQIMATGSMRDLAAPHRLRVVELSDGNCVLCVGRAKDEDSAELQRLQRKFASFQMASGSRPFRSAEVCGSPE
ncbi:MAG: hypothetical protein PVJ27_05225 [Candidatus Brocadiaceae bacterium]|jgi:hypothetical protein